MSDDQSTTHGAVHIASEQHHHHTHTPDSQHPGGHHLLQIEHLTISFLMYDSSEPFFRAHKHKVEVVHDLSLSVHAGEIVAVVGASGAGKTLLADTIMGIFEPNASVSADIWFDGKLQDAKSLQELRGHGISLIPQGVAGLDPLMPVGKQIETSSCRHNEDRTAKRKKLFEHYGLAEDVARLYPFELSGGMARRVLLCCAFMDNPRVIIADEPTPGLDLERSLTALADLRAFADEGGGVILITHDIELALRVADRIAVFRDGTIVEETSVQNFASPETLSHPFSRALWHALPEHDFVAIRCQDLSEEGGSPC